MSVDHARHEFGPPHKQTKVEQPRIGDTTHPPYTNYGPAPAYQYGSPHAPVHINGNVSGGLDASRPPEFHYLPRPVPPGPPPATPVTGPAYTYPNHGLVSQYGHNVPQVTAVTTLPQIPRNPHAYPLNHNVLTPRSQIAPNTYKPDHSTAPREPVALVWWFVSEISKLSTLRYQHHLGHPNMSQPYNSSQVSYHELDATAEKERQREENRGRKQRWRKDNPDRNKDNDLRCRVNKIAKAKFGTTESPEKDAFIEAEFTSRRAKRERRDAKNAAHSDSLHLFSTNERTKQDLDVALQESINPDVEAAGHELMRIVAEVQTRSGPHQIPESSINNARRWIEKLESGTANTEAMSAAMDIASQNHTFASALYSGLMDRNGGNEYASTSGSDELQVTTPATGNGVHMSGLSISREASAGFPQQPRSAVAMVNGLTGPKTYTSPYERPSPSNESTAPLSTKSGKAKTPERREKPTVPTQEGDSKSNPTDESNIDAIIELADAVISDDEDDEDGPADGSPHARSVDQDTKMPDAGGQEDDNSEEARRRYAETTVNTIIPVSQAQAASRISLLPRQSPATRGRNGNASSQTCSSYQEEQRKIKLYGYPPLPSWGSVERRRNN